MITQNDVFTICDYGYLRLRTLTIGSFMPHLWQKTDVNRKCPKPGTQRILSSR